MARSAGKKLKHLARALHFTFCFNNHEAIQQECLWLCPFQNYCWCKVHVQTNSFINALRQTWVWPEFGQIRGFCRIESSQSTTTSSQHKRPSSELHKNLSLFAKRGGGLIRCCPSINVGLHNDAVLYGDAAPAPPSMPASSAASLRRLRVSAALPRASRRRFALASMHFRIDTFRSCARPYRHIHRLTS